MRKLFGRFRKAIFMLIKTQKAQIIDALIERFKRQKMVILTNFRGTSVMVLQSLRRTLKRGGAEYKVAKKTLIHRALNAIGTEGISVKEREGELGLVFGYRDEQTALARIISKFSKQHETFRIIGGLLGKRILTDKEVMTLAKLPPREVLLAHLVGTLQSPLRSLAVVLQGNLKNFVVVLNKIQSSKPK